MAKKLAKKKRVPTIVVFKVRPQKDFLNGAYQDQYTLERHKIGLLGSYTIQVVGTLFGKNRRKALLIASTLNNGIKRK